MFSGAEAPSHWFILAIVVVLLFGYKKLPDAARSIGRSLRIFKTEMKGMSEDEAARTAVAPVTPVAPEAAIPPAAAPPAAQAPAAPVAPVPVTPAAAPVNPVPAAPAVAPEAVAQQTPTQAEVPVALDKPVADPAIENPTAPSAPPAG